MAHEGRRQLQKLGKRFGLTQEQFGLRYNTDVRAPQN
jgi:hypothetical protein